MSFHVSPAQTYLQWGFIEIRSDERSVIKAASRELNELIKEKNLKFNSIGFSPRYAQFEIAEILRGEELGYLQSDLRDPEIRWAREELMRIFGLDPAKSYLQNVRKLGIETVLEPQFKAIVSARISYKTATTQCHRRSLTSGTKARRNSARNTRGSLACRPKLTRRHFTAKLK